MDIQNHITESQMLIDNGKQLAHADIKEFHSIPALVIPRDCEIKLFPDLRETPLRIDEVVNHATAQSFIDYWTAYKNDNSAIFVNTTDNIFLAIFDYHNTESNWKKHHSLFKLKKTVEWKTWQENDKKAMNQHDFGMFIEQNLEEIIDPVGAEMQEIAMSLQAKSKVNFEKATRLDNGQTQFVYQETIEAKAGQNGQFKIPQQFTIGLKLFEGGEAYKMEAKFRYRIKDGNLAIWYELMRPHKTIEANLNDTLELIKAGCATTAFYSAVL